MRITSITESNLHNNAETSGAESGAVNGKKGNLAAEQDTELVELIDAWPMLPEHIKAAIRALVGSHLQEADT